MLRQIMQIALAAAIIFAATYLKADPVDQSVMVLFEAEIIEGKSDDVSALLYRMVAFNQPDEPQTLVYRAYISEDRQRLTFMETYSNTDAMLFHDQRFTDTFADELFAMTRNPRLCVYGPVLDSYKQFAEEAGFTIEYSALVAGFSR